MTRQGPAAGGQAAAAGSGGHAAGTVWVAGFGRVSLAGPVRLSDNVRWVRQSEGFTRMLLAGKELVGLHLLERLWLPAKRSRLVAK